MEIIVKEMFEKGYPDILICICIPLIISILTIALPLFIQVISGDRKSVV